VGLKTDILILRKDNTSVKSRDEDIFNEINRRYLQQRKRKKI
jgi:hypothetical protein